MRFGYVTILILSFIAISGCEVTKPITTPSPDMPLTDFAKNTSTIEKPQQYQEIIYFQNGSSFLLAEEAQKINRLLNATKPRGISSIEVTGHTDANGSASDNLNISRRRAATVKSQLIKMGSDANAISSQGYGETKLFIDTGDGAKEQLNNRVEILVKGDKKLSDCQQDGMKKQNGRLTKQRRFDCVTVFYGTNRKRQDDLQNPYGQVPITADQDTILGKLVVSIPSKHLPGSKIEKLRRKIKKPTREHRREAFTLWDWDKNDELTREMFQYLARNKLKASGPYENQAFVFIHGYNTIFRDAVLRTAQIKTDIEFDGPVFLYSWPANGKTSQYFSDQDDADLSARRLVEYLQIIKTGLHQDTKIHIIAHSMGNRVFAQALNQMKALPPEQRVNFDVAIFAAADVSARLFEEWVVNNVSNSAADTDKVAINRAVIYATDDDRPLGLSNFARQIGVDKIDFVSRVGLIKNHMPTIFNKPFKTMDLSKIDISIFDFNHSKYAESLPTVCHVGQLFRGQLATQSSETSRIIEKRIKGKIFWIMKKRPTKAKRCRWE